MRIVLLFLGSCLCVSAVRLQPATHSFGSGFRLRRAPAPCLQFGDFKMPEWKLPGFSEPKQEPKEMKEKEEKTPEPDRDFGDMIGDFLFGKGSMDSDVDAIFGIKRTRNVPDMYPATKTEFADPVEGDSGEVALLRPMLKNTKLEERELRLAYDSRRHGWSVRAWRSKVDAQGPCIIVAKTKGGKVFGGYASKGFVGVGEDRGDLGAFLFTWPGRDTSQPFIKLQKLQPASAATVDYPENGPQFGRDALLIELGSRSAFSKLGLDYEILRVDNKVFRSIFADEGATAQLSELRTYVGVWPIGPGDDEFDRIPFSGALFGANW